ncbi:hypothetical protein DPEC_G00159510 [Dallia pectoralis]|uniref:Uncharacterized protein n=1 Tax=Dallia pectoralis TaxID=75939 RepID=A0ACC2GG42_DALPE|nr:hypothetical protein DPEC_G00159510 [Dallia pectoralis]
METVSEGSGGELVGEENNLVVSVQQKSVKKNNEELSDHHQVEGKKGKLEGESSRSDTSIVEGPRIFPSDSPNRLSFLTNIVMASTPGSSSPKPQRLKANQYAGNESPEFS